MMRRALSAIAMVSAGAIGVSACPAAKVQPSTPSTAPPTSMASSSADGSPPIANAALSTAVDASPSDASRGPLVASADVPRAPKLRVRRLRNEGAATCNASALLAQLGACRALRTSTYDGTSAPSRSTNAADTSPANAFAMETCRVWNSGGPPPQAIRAALEEDLPIAGVLFVPEMTPSGRAVHVIELDASTFLAEASFTSSAAHVVVFDRPASAKTLTVRTTTSPSWVAWQKVVPFTCEGSASLESTTEVSPETPRPRPRQEWIEVRVPGRGACAKDDDCVPHSCCHPRTCGSKDLAPSCAGIGCPQNVVEGTIGQGARCACIEGKCGALRRERPPAPGLL